MLWRNGLPGDRRQEFWLTQCQIKSLWYNGDNHNSNVIHQTYVKPTLA